MHRHACGHGHHWDCAGSAVREQDCQPTECICLDHGVPMEGGDHSRCTIEIFTCPDHRVGNRKTRNAQTPLKEEVEDGFVPIRVPEDFDAMLQRWLDDSTPGIGICFMCGNPILGQEDLIPGTPIHNCAAGRSDFIADVNKTTPVKPNDREDACEEW